MIHRYIDTYINSFNTLLKHTYIRTYILNDTYIPTYIHKFVQHARCHSLHSQCNRSGRVTYIHTYCMTLYTCIHIYIHTYIHAGCLQTAGPCSSIRSHRRYPGQLLSGQHSGHTNHQYGIHQNHNILLHVHEAPGSICQVPIQRVHAEQIPLRYCKRSRT